jgi:hypothetical protein
LCAYVIALAIELGWVVHGKKHVENDFGRNYILVKNHFRDFDVTGVAIADLLIGGVRLCAAHVANFDVLNALELHVCAVEAPEAPAT